MVVGKGIVLAPFQALKRRRLRRFYSPPYRCSDDVQGPSDTGEGRLFRLVSGALQKPFKVRLNHHSGTIRAPIAALFRCQLQHHSGAICNTVRSTVSGVLQAPCEAHAMRHSSATFQVPFSGDLDSVQALFFRHFRCRWEASVLGAASVHLGIVLPPFRYRVSATNSHHYGAILTLILVIERGAMASFGGILPPPASFEDGSNTADYAVAGVHWCRFPMPFWLSNVKGNIKILEFW